MITFNKLLSSMLLMIIILGSCDIAKELTGEIAGQTGDDIISFLFPSTPGGTPVETVPSNYTEIRTRADLEAVVNNLDGNYMLMEDIDLSPGGEWTPIGNSSGPFTGDFDGNFHTIGGLSINSPSTGKVGLFGELGSSANIATVKNITIGVTQIIGASEVGALAGIAAATITNVHVYMGSVEGTSNVGGLVGKLEIFGNSEVISSAAHTAVIGTGSKIGGLVGKSFHSITNSYATGAVTGSAKVGGLIGETQGNSLLTKQNYATGVVTGTSSVGGLVGELISATDATIDHNYATGAVFGTTSSVGGLVGRATQGRILNSYATGTVSDGGYGAEGGGILGESLMGTTEFTFLKDNYYDPEKTGKTTGVGSSGSIAIAASQPIAIIESAITAATFPWSNTIWSFTENQWPTLQWQ